ncbi:YciI family protein [Nocardioides sp.]|uniref:YciI family protein n=1 Tax=Nocardioides sp. TaxID=35761 RepID=UPI003D103E0B
MSQYLLSVHGSIDDTMPPEDEIQRMYAATGKFNDELRSSGKWVFAGGLHPITSATVVDGTGTGTVITDGPYVESKEYLGGFWVIEAEDLDEALALAARGSAACGGKVEVRPFQDV